MLSKRSAMFATGAAVLVALSGSRMVGAADANWASYANGSRPFDAVAGGRDSDGNPLYYCRANFGTDFQPGKLNSTHTTCDFAYGGTEKHAPSYYVLIPHGVSASGGIVPPGSFEAGPDTDGAPLYFCHANYLGGLQPGKLKAGAGCYIAYGGNEILLKNYDALQDDLPMTTDPQHTAFTIIGGHEANGSAIPLCVTTYSVSVGGREVSSQQPGKIVSDHLCHFSYGGKEHMADLYAEVRADDLRTPAIAHFDFVVGYDTNLAPLYACKGIHNNSEQLGKYRGDFGGLCHISYGGQEVTADPSTTAVVDGLNRVFP